MEREDTGSAIHRVIIREQGIVRGVDYRPPYPRSSASNDEHPNCCRGTRHDREHGPDHGANQRNDHTIPAIGSDRNRHLHQQRTQGSEPYQREDSGVRHAERVPNIRQQDSKCRAVEFIGGIQPEKN